MQTKDDGKHAILPVAVHPDHAGMPVTLPRESDGNMCRDGSDVVWLLQPSDEKSAVDERGRVHGAPELSPVKELLAAEKFRVDYRARSERRRCRSSRPKCPRLRGQDKARFLAAGTSFLSVCLHIVFGSHRADPARCAGAGKANSLSVFNAVLCVTRNVRHVRFRRFYAVASISTPRHYTSIFDLASAV